MTFLFRCIPLFILVAYSNGFSPSINNTPYRGACLLASSSDVAIRAAQICLDDRTRKAWKKQVKQKYPLLPGSTVDVVLGVASDAFKVVTPDELKRALTPGGIEAERPKLKRKLADALLVSLSPTLGSFLSQKEQQVVRRPALDIALDNLTANLPELLKQQEDRLFALQEEAASLQREMGWRKLLWFRLRRRKWRRRYQSLSK